MKNSIHTFYSSTVVAVIVFVCAPLLADERRDSAEMTKLIQPICESVGHSVAQVFSGARPVALATAVTEHGFLLTKRSELSGDPIRVRLSDGRFYPARVASVRRRNDLALIRIDGDVRLIPAKFDNYSPPIASFLISVGRTRRSIGIGTLGVRDRSVMHQGRLGVELKDDASGRALVEKVHPKSGANTAGVESGDRIVAINGRREANSDTVIQTLRGMYPGEDVRLTILRANESNGVETLELDARIRDYGMMRESENDSRVNGPRNDRLSGFDRVFQHDTVLDPDECGGPVLDTSGRVVGMNIARAGRVVTYSLPSSLINAELGEMLLEARK